MATGEEHVAAAAAVEETPEKKEDGTTELPAPSGWKKKVLKFCTHVDNLKEIIAFILWIMAAWTEIAEILVQLSLQIKQLPDLVKLDEW